MTEQERLALATELQEKGDAFVALCSRISGIPFDPEGQDEMSLDAWFAAALSVLESWS